MITGKPPTNSSGRSVALVKLATAQAVSIPHAADVLTSRKKKEEAGADICSASSLSSMTASEIQFYNAPPKCIVQVLWFIIYGSVNASVTYSNLNFLLIAADGGKPKQVSSMNLVDYSPSSGSTIASGMH